MKITKFGHCCLLIEEGGLRIVTDPGTFTTEQDGLTNIDVILISHEHADHFHVESVKKMVVNNPQAKIITNKPVAALIAEAGVKAEVIVVEHGEKHVEKGVSFDAFGKAHAPIYGNMPSVENTGYFIGPRLYYPADAFYNPKANDGREIEILALPVGGPWMKTSEAIDYALAVAPKTIFPVHDGLYLNPKMGMMMVERFITSLAPGIAIVTLDIGKETEF